MLDVLLALKAALKINTVDIDNFIFTLHYKFTFLFLIAASVLVACKQYFGDPISCDYDTRNSKAPANPEIMVNPVFTSRCNKFNLIF
jgi:Innexin